MTKFKIAIVEGSYRRQSIDRKLAQALVTLADKHVVPTFVQLDDVPTHNQDLERPLPASVARFKADIGEVDGALFITAKYNRSIPTVLKHAFDWGARPHGRNSWAGRPVAMTGTSPGAIGSAVAQRRLRQIATRDHWLWRRSLCHLQARPARRSRHHHGPGYTAVPCSPLSSSLPLSSLASTASRP
jgi:chromate reductase, NAD(P)H dehydrogenase (quinone)